ncbi:MAG: WD40-like beta Propeller containing protein [Bacteroidota bacterium]|jgi:hypothetical protein|nr:WD40-like beta Propeller containing protein [Bacteroidota bacterium]
MLGPDIEKRGDFKLVIRPDPEFILMTMHPTRSGIYMNKQLRFVFLFLLVIMSGFRPVFSQAAFASEDELKQQALKLFEDDEFEEAYPLYSQLASLYPKDPNYNYRLGVCMLYASDDKEKAIPFLEFAATKPDVEKEVFFYLAKAYHLNYRFDDAIAKYLAYSRVASEAKSNKLQVDHQIEMCTSGKKLLRNITDLIVIDKKELSRTDFYRAYDISDIGGKLLAKPDEESFRTPLDKKKKEKSIIYLATNNNQVYFSSFGDDLEHGKDIYIIRKLPTGEWSKPQTLGYPVNTEYDEDYPFLHPNGKVLYFCSKGHNSMGGYDIFKTTLNEETNTWNKPVNLDFPINTPDDDILYVTNEDEKEAFFSSARSSKTGKTAVFHINVERRPIDVAIVKGMVVKTKDDQALDVKITVKDLADNTILGMYNAKETGNYLINLPNGGKFMYTVEATGFNTQSEIVVLPTQYEFKPLKQEISYEKGTDKLIIKNLFDEPVDDQSYLLALNFIKEKARMEAGVDAANAAAAAKNNASADEGNNNSTANNTEKAGDNKTGDNSKSTPSGASLSNDAIVKIAYDDAKEAETEAKDLQEQADIALNLANQKNELAQNKTQEAAQLMSDANSMTDNVKKQTALDEATQAREESETLNQETVAAFNIAKKLQQKAVAKDEEADLAMQYAKALEAAVKSKNPGEALEKLKQQEEKLEELSQKNGNAEPDNIYAGLKMDSETKKRELDKATQTSEDIKQEIADNETLITTLAVDAEKTKKDDLKKGLLDQIEGLKADNEQSRKDLESNDLKVAKLTKEFNGIKNEMELVSNVVDKAKTGTNEAAAASVASIDKTKLEQQVNDLKTGIDRSPVTPTIAKNTTNSGTAQSDSNSENKATNDIASSSKTEAGQSNSNANKNGTANSPEVTAGNDKGNDVAANTNAQKGINESSSKTNNNGDNKSNDVASNNNSQNSNEAGNQNSTETKNTSGDNGNDLAVNSNSSQGTVKTNSGNSTDNASKAENLNAGNPNTAIVAESGLDYSKQYTDQLAATDNISDPLVKENKKAELYSNWVSTLNEDLSKKQDALKTEKNKTRKKELAAEISTLESELKAKQDLEKASIASAENLKASSNAIAAKNDNQAENNSSSVNASESPSTASISSINESFNNKLSETASITSAADRESKKSEIFKDWSAAINENVEKQKQDMAASTDPEMKALLVKKIADAETLMKEKADQSVASADKAATLKQQESGLAVNNGNKTSESSSDKSSSDNKSENSSQDNNSAVSNNSSFTDSGNGNVATNAIANNAVKADLNQKLNAGVNTAENEETDLAREEKKAVAYQEYISGMKEQIGSIQKNFVQEKDEARKNQLSTEITAMQSDVAEKQKLLDNSQAKIKSIEESALAVNQNKSASSNENSAAENNTNISEDNSQSGKRSPITNNNLSTTSQVYTNPVAIDKANAAASDSKAADDLIAQSKALKEEAASKPDQKEKDALFIKANNLSAQAEEKQINAAQLSSDAAKSEFLANKNVLDQLVVVSASNKSDEVAMAEMMKDESNLYFEKAQKSRDMIPGMRTNTDKLAALEDANNNEKIALEKQRKATAIYQKANPDFVAVNTNDASSGLAANPDKTSGNKSSASTDKVSNPNSGNENSNNKDIAKSDQTTDAGNVMKSADQSANETNTNSAENNSGNDQIKVTDNSTKNDQSSIVDNSKSTAIDQNASTNTEAPDKTNSDNNAIADNTQKSSETNTDNIANAENKTSETNDAAVKSTDVTAGNVNPPENTTGKVASENKSTESNTAKNQTQVVLAPSEKFERTPQATYSSSKPIPVNEKLPEGLIYKVQIGAFRNPIAPEQFNGMSPITAETTTQGFTRYTAGLFTKFSTADQVKNEIRQLGYKDAFVVVFLNGKRISVAEALKLQGENPDLAVTAETSNNNSTQEGVTKTNTAVNSASPDKGNDQSVNANEIAKAENISTVSGLLYTVQVGVYSQPMTSAKLFNIQPLLSENLPNGKIRYNTGIYNNFGKAVEARNVIAAAGVKDAFVTAYYQGKRITLPEARTLEAQGNSVFATTSSMNQLPSLNGNNANMSIQVDNKKETAVTALNNNAESTSDQTSPETNTQPSTNTELKTTLEINNAVSDSGVVYKVQIGAFKDEVPLSIANQFLKIANKGIKNYKDPNGLTIYTLGSFTSYEQASSLKAEIAGVVSDAFVVAYNNGNKISIDEAKSLQNK